MKRQTRYSFIIDTDAYSGNFEREMGGFVVGRYDDHGDFRGGPYRTLFRAQFTDKYFKDPFEDRIELRVAEHDGVPYLTPVVIAPTPGWSNDGNGKHKKLKAREKKKYDAYQSVAIFFARKPTTAQLKILIERARAFASLPTTKPWDTRPKILGCRAKKRATKSNPPGPPRVVTRVVQKPYFAKKGDRGKHGVPRDNIEDAMEDARKIGVGAVVVSAEGVVLARWVSATSKQW